MQKEKNTLTRKQVDQLLIDQQNKGYPNFKNRIVHTLINEYSISFADAAYYAYHPEVSDKINDDIEWAQHMGARYWAELIFDHYVKNPKLQLN